jgi:hypothetical protein
MDTNVTVVERPTSLAESKLQSFYNLTVRQAIFVVEFIRLMDEGKAARAAGLSSPPQMTGNLLQAIKDQLRARMERTLITGDRVVAKLGEIAFAPNQQPTNQLKALDLLMKHFGLYAPQQSSLTLGGSIGVEHKLDLSKLTNEDLERLYDLVGKINPGTAGRVTDPAGNSGHH